MTQDTETKNLATINPVNFNLEPENLEPKNLSAWLSYIESLHPKSISMGLDRVNRMIARLNLSPKFPIITVTGTNGKGSTCAMLAQIYKQAGYQVGCYTSPHLLRYNERVRVNGIEASDTDLCTAFAAVDAARTGADDIEISLTYFEVGTLAAMWHFMQADLDIAIMEIGLGGRLDAVNAFEPSSTIVTSVALDHQEYLGDTRESIGFEKAGVYRKSKAAICGDANPPASLISHAKQIQADFKRIHHDFDYQVVENGWQFLQDGKVVYTLPKPALQGTYQLANASCAMSAVESLQSKLPVTINALASAMQQVSLAGRFQIVAKTKSNAPRVILDVAHNPHAAQALSGNLNASKTQYAKADGAVSTTKTFAVFAMLIDKDIQGVVSALQNEIDVWYVAGINHTRGAQATDLAEVIAIVSPLAVVKMFDSADNAYQQACIDMSENDKIVVFGSFFTVASVLQVISTGLISE